MPQRYPSPYPEDAPETWQPNPQRVRRPRSAQGQTRMDDTQPFRDRPVYRVEPTPQGTFRYDSDTDWEPSTPRKKKKKRPLATAMWSLLTFVCVALVAVTVVLMLPQLTGVRFANLPNLAFVNGHLVALDLATYDQYLLGRSDLAGEKIYPGITIDGYDVSGMTQGEALAYLQQADPVRTEEFAATIEIGNQSWRIDSTMLPMTRNREDLVHQAYAVGRRNTTTLRGSHVTPFQERLQQVQALRANPLNLTSEVTYDYTAIRQWTDSIAAYVNRDPVDATVATFDFSTHEFTFTDDISGAHVDADMLYQTVADKLKSGEKNAFLRIEPEELLATVTKAELMNSFSLISSYTTETTSNSNRNTNINLSAQAINGRTVMPGETFSFNEATGKRTSQKGYLEADAISGGQSVPEVGGGVCQTSSTLFNAVARANLEIVQRSPHAWPSSYVPKGFDATVNWPNLDFQFRNNTDYPIFIIAHYEKRKVTVEIYGMVLGSGVSIDLESEVTRTIRPSDEPKYKQNPDLAPGTQVQTVKKRTGYEVDTYKVWYQNGVETSRELLVHSTYKAYQGVVEYN